MVSFTSITNGILLVSVAIFLGSTEAAPAAGSKGTTSQPAPHVNSTAVESSFKLPPIITIRTQFGTPSFKGDLNAESESIESNKHWYVEHGGNLKNLTKRETETVGGMTMDLPSNAPPEIKLFGSGVVTATTAQIEQFKLYAGLAATSYCRGVVPLGLWNCKNCLKYAPDGKLLVTFSSLLADTNGFVLRSDAQKTIHLVFRGTNSIRSAVVDMVFDFDNYPPVFGAKVHRGFLSSYNEVVSKFFPVVQEQLTNNPDYKVVVSGHSLGGAQALFAALDLYQRDKRLSPKNLSVYTVGCPRVGNPIFALYVDSTGIPFSRSVNNRDIVPHLPAQAMGYLHPGVEAWTTSSSKVQICTANIETNKCSNSIVPFTSFTDHLTYYGINEGLCL